MRNPLLIMLLLTGIGAVGEADEIKLPIPAGVTRPWPGAAWWTNPWEDWAIREGRLENVASGGDRKAVILTAELTGQAAPFRLRTRIYQTSFEMRGDGYVGFEIGLQGTFGDYRDSAVHGNGFAAGIDARGRLFIGSPPPDGPIMRQPVRDVRLELSGEVVDGGTRLVLQVLDENGNSQSEVSVDRVHASWLTGLVAIACSSQAPETADLAAPRPQNHRGCAQTRGGEMRFAFDQIALTGERVKAYPERAFGPILWTTHTRDNDGNLNLLLQAAPFGATEKLEATLDLEGRETQYARLDPASRTASFQLRRLDPNRAFPFVAKLADGEWKGTIRAVPDAAKPCVIASLSCNDATGFPHQDLVANVTAQHPDLVTFLGDQIYEGVGGYGLLYDQRPNDRAVLSYLRKYAMHGWIWRDLLRDIPSVTIPDDHDVFHGNLWGAGGQLADVSSGFAKPAQDSGGYKMSVDFVNVVHRTQTGNLPDPLDATPCESGISVYFTRFACGPFDFAIIADRQFKSAPAKAMPDARIENGWPQNPKWNPLTPAPPEAELLGKRQETFLGRWAAVPAANAPFRVVLSQSPWLAPQTLPKAMTSDDGVPKLKVGRAGEYAPDDEPKPDYDTNGWPQAKRTLALGHLRQAKAFHLTGDQHLGTTGQYGLKTPDDGPWWVSTPATANTFPRRWMPAVEGKNRRPGDPKWLGAFTDAFGNPFTLHAVANPQDVDREPARLFDRAVGYTITTWDRAAGHVAIANWPYWASPAKHGADAKPYPGWPVKVDLKSLDRID